MQSIQQMRRGGIPRGLGRTGPIILSYGFRPFFLGAAIWGLLAMLLWIGNVSLGLGLGGAAGGSAWHAHEMLFGYSSAALAGFLLTAVPNWTGRLPVSGRPLLLLFALWIAGRVALMWPEMLGPMLSAVVDGAFLPTLLLICAREIVAGRKWKDIKVLAALTGLTLANLAFHANMLLSGDVGLSSRLSISAYLTLIMIIGGRILPSFTRNWLARQGATALPAPHDRLDVACLVLGVMSLAIWTMAPDGAAAGTACLVTALAHAWRLARWRGWATLAEPLVLILHVAYGFVVLSFVALGAAALEWLEPTAGLHVATVGCIGAMTLAVMTRATRGHTGLALAASSMTVWSYAAMVLAGAIRPMTAFFPEQHDALVGGAGLMWCLAFLLFLIEYGPVLMTRRKDLPPARGR